MEPTTAKSKRVTMYYNGLYAYIETEIELEGATPEQVWAVFADFASWPRWSSSGFMTFLKQPSAVGKRCGLVCKLSQGAMKSSTHWPVVERFDAGRELMWRDFSPIVAPFWHGCHWFRFAPLPGGRGTRLRHGTRQMGLAMPALWDAMVSTEVGYHAFNEELAAEVARVRARNNVAHGPAAAATAASAATAAAATAAPSAAKVGGPAAAAMARATAKKAAAAGALVAAAAAAEPSHGHAFAAKNKGTRHGEAGDRVSKLPALITAERHA